MAAPPIPPRAAIVELARAAVREDLGAGDISAQLVSVAAVARARLICRQSAILCGAEWFAETFRQVEPAVKINWRHHDGARLRANAAVCEITGPARAMLTAERAAINLLQTLSGTATAANAYARLLADTDSKAVLRDTRKTIPGLRVAQKYAAAVGGICNHRMGLFDQILLKENHIHMADGVAAALTRARAVADERRPPMPIQIEVETLAQLRQALAADATRILLDNFTVANLHKAVKIADGRAELEASGDIGRENVVAVARTGVDYIAIGALTKHLTAIDFSMRFDE